MLTLNDRRNELWQWDTNRKLTVDVDCSQVHFSNKVFGRSIDVDVVDGTAAIPDVLLQVDNELIAWAFVGTPENGYTKISKVFKVNKRNKPADYVFTPPEQTTLGQIMKRLDRIEESQDPDAIKNAVDDYLANNPIQIDEKDPTVPAWSKQPQKPSYSAQEVGAESAGTAAAAVSGHNTSADAHNDLRLELKAISSRLNAFFDSDDQTLDELSEIVAYITSNKSLIDAITTSKVSVSDIVDNLTTNTGNRPLSAAQGVVLKGLIDTVSNNLSKYQPKGDYLGREELPAAVNDALAQAKASGEFKGDPGTPGKDGAAGKDGYTPVKGVDYFDGKDGQNGSPGKDGTSVTVKSVSESNADGGNNVVTFSDGKTLTVKNGSKGSDGQPGADGKDGQNGKSAYQYAAEAGFTGTAKEFSEKLAAVGSSGGQEREFFKLEPDGPVTSGPVTWISYNALKGTDEVTVIYDGTEYVCPVTFQESFPNGPDGIDESFFYLGNYNGSAPEYPFFIWGYRVNDASTLGVGEGQHTISVVKKIDKIYLPSELFQEKDDVDWDVFPKASYALDQDATYGFTGVEPLTPERTYIVTIDGVEYERKAKYDENWDHTYVGSSHIFETFTKADENDDVFCFWTWDDGQGAIYMNKPDYANKTVVFGVREKKDSSGGVSSWNDLTDRPFYSETLIVDPVFDGDITGWEAILVQEGMYAVKVSPQYVSAADMIGETLTVNMGGAEQTIPLTEDNAIDASYVLGVAGAAVGLGADVIVLSFPEDTTAMGATFTAGTWFGCIPGQFYVKSLSCLTAESVEIIKKIDSKFLPPIEEEDLPKSVMTEEEYNARRTHWTDEDGTVHQLDRKYIPAEWLAVKVPTEITFMPSATVETKATGYTDLQSLCMYHSSTVRKAQTVAINYDGVRYAYESGTTVYGNGRLQNSNKEDTGEPFCIHFRDEEDKSSIVRLYTNDTESSEHTISIEMDGVILPVLMPEEYLPESVDGVVVRSSTSGSTKKFKITVDDNGTITATEVT